MSKLITFNSFKIDEVLEEFSGHFNETVNDDGVEQQISIPAKFGHGEIKALDFRDGLSVFLFNGVLKDELTLNYVCKKEQPLRLLFSIKEEFYHNTTTDGPRYQLQSMLSSMVSGKTGSEQSIIIPPNKSVVFYCIDINREKYLNKMSRAVTLMPDELKAVFEDINGQVPFLYMGGYNLAISQCIDNIMQNAFGGAVKRVYIESQTLEILSMVIKQFIEDLLPEKKQKGLRKRDLELIVEARKKLLLNLVNPPTIRELAQMMGTNENKLKAGFRLLYDTSINKLLQDERLTKAKLLITEESYPIKEVAKMVGYKHSAHFASKFKKRFGVLPNTYLKSITK